MLKTVKDWMIYLRNLPLKRDDIFFFKDVISF